MTTLDDDVYQAIEAVRGKLPYAVVDTTTISERGHVKLLGLFADAEEAARYIGALPDLEGVRMGRYSIDGPSDD